MQRRIRAAVAATALVLSVCTFGLVGSPTAAAAEPIVVGDCSTSVRGEPGQPVSLAPKAVLGIVTDAVRAVPLLGPPLAGTVNKVFGALPPIPIGALPTGSGHITGGTIAKAVIAEVREIPALGPILGTVVGTLRSTLSSVCDIAVTGVNAVSAPVQDGADAVADAAEEATERIVPGGVTGPGPGNPGGETPGGTPERPGQNPGTPPATDHPPVGGMTPGGWSLYPPGLGHLGRSPLDLYGSVPFARPGLYAPSPGVRYGGAVPGYSPQFGVLGTDGPADDGVQAAGRAEALDPPAGQHIELPVLLAVLALSVVTAALVRTWVLRRAPSATL
ncbi:hypothetical protein [Actinophytocola gossypii]|uniref:Uncharacterized protein n=1 Tax=Actinophytocola gossypii TaxID=2812003 RepID=A0ABT2JFE4_9PSEU|nr:hypothetical protein [Actinophytocola gossypii]MCT2586486.1 hypothetical protein [Actinophytocola gossypii]